ncbi:hypothetical protein B0T24DRAFT_674860 [Lasiosphaeria ovina]|uniref:ATP phosphoribosyltransferase catalytic domain-containing protein n=1 Tax=Lasiosphaeria ovina TaxID=92902 RepID=A0AAE0KMM3_9PEZI|nr:hypothetical protein B0T24DRAFT_674860 [Lasiosphaeria ovina]
MQIHRGRKSTSYTLAQGDIEAVGENSPVIPRDNYEDHSDDNYEVSFDDELSNKILVVIDDISTASCHEHASTSNKSSSSLPAPTQPPSPPTTKKPNTLPSPVNDTTETVPFSARVIRRLVESDMDEYDAVTDRMLRAPPLFGSALYAAFHRLQYHPISRKPEVTDPAAADILPPPDEDVAKALRRPRCATIVLARLQRELQPPVVAAEKESTPVAPVKLKTRILELHGNMKAVRYLGGVVDAFVDVVESGEAMKAAGFKAVDTVLESQAVLISLSISPYIDSEVLALPLCYHA